MLHVGDFEEQSCAVLFEEQSRAVLEGAGDEELATVEAYIHGIAQSAEEKRGLQARNHNGNRQRNPLAAPALRADRLVYQHMRLSFARSWLLS